MATKKELEDLIDMLQVEIEQLEEQVEKLRSGKTQQESQGSVLTRFVEELKTHLDYPKFRHIEMKREILRLIDQLKAKVIQ